MLIARCQPYPVWDRRPPREAVVLIQVDRLVRKLGHLERPEEVRDREEDLALGERHPRAYSTAGIIYAARGYVSESLHR